MSRRDKKTIYQMEFGSESERLKYKRQMEDSVQLGVSPEVPSGYGLPRRDDAAVGPGRGGKQRLAQNNNGGGARSFSRRTDEILL